MHYYLGDRPTPIRVEPASVDDPSFIAAATAEIVTEQGVALERTATWADGRVTVDLDTLPVVGAHTLRIVVAGGGRQQALSPVALIVEHEDGDGWFTLDAARTAWADAPEDDGRLHTLLVVARTQCLAYAPALAVGAAVPRHYREAQLLQARGVWNAVRTDPNSQQMGADGFAAPVFPLDWTVKQLLRPQDPRPVVA
jgi:hypothetical protein